MCPSGKDEKSRRRRRALSFGRDCLRQQCGVSATSSASCFVTSPQLAASRQLCQYNLYNLSLRNDHVACEQLSTPKLPIKTRSNSYIDCQSTCSIATLSSGRDRRHPLHPSNNDSRPGNPHRRLHMTKNRSETIRQANRVQR